MIYRLLNTMSKVDITDKISSPYSDNNKVVPRVSDILKFCINEEYIANWANALGFKRKRYKDELQRLADLGSATHEAIEEFFRSGVESDNIGFKGFKLWWDIVTTNNNVKVLAFEESITTPFIGGTIDCLLEINGKYYLVDFKTSTNITIKHFLQLAAYKYMLHIDKGIIIDGAIILQLNKNTPAFGEYLLDFKISEHNKFIMECQETFLMMVCQYYQYIDSTRKFGEIFGNKR